MRFLVERPFFQAPMRRVRPQQLTYVERYYLLSNRIPGQSPRHFRPVHTQHQISNTRKKTWAAQASYSPYVVVLLVIGGGLAASEYYYRDISKPVTSSTAHNLIDKDNRIPLYSRMSTPEGHLGNLTQEQELKLKEFWAITLKTFGVQDEDGSRQQLNGLSPRTSIDTTSASESESPEKKKKPKRISLFGRRHDDSSKNGSAEEDDKYGQTAELQSILSQVTPESLRNTYWTMLKADHPDQLLLRFLRARKWDVNRALAMLISTLHWRKETMQVDDDVIFQGEAGAQRDESSSDSSTKREGHDFLAQLRLGKSFLHGTDKEGRPLTYVRARLHRGGEQTERAMERFTVYVIETARLTLKAPVETACIVFDMTDFTMANMDYTPVKFMIKIFEANYPESLGAVLVHKAPWIFQGVWKIIRGWLDPVVASKVHFTNSVDDMSQFIPREQVIKDLGGEEAWEYRYVEPNEDENKAMKDTVNRDKLMDERRSEILKYQQQTFEWLHSSSNSESGEKAKTGRNDIAERLCTNYWQLDPYIRARSLYDRVGMIQPGGKIDFYPTHQAIKPESAATAKPDTNSDDVD